jgi:hypothetical protein
MTLLNKSNFRYLLDTFIYDRALYPGPPHSVDLNEVQRLYGKRIIILKKFYICIYTNHFYFNYQSF